MSNATVLPVLAALLATSCSSDVQPARDGGRDDVAATSCSSDVQPARDGGRDDMAQLDGSKLDAGRDAPSRDSGADVDDMLVVDNYVGTVLPLSLSLVEGATATFSVVLSGEPSVDATILLSVSDPTQAMLDATQLVFDSSNFSQPQVVSVTAIDDQIPETQAVVVVSVGSAPGGGLDGIELDDVMLTITDDDVAGFDVSPTFLSISETGPTSATFTVVPTAQPSVPIAVPITHLGTEVTVAPTSVTFDTSNWQVPAIVTVTAVDDARCDGNIATLVEVGPVSSADLLWAGLDPSDVTVSVLDDEGCDVSVVPSTGLTTTEAGGTATFMVVLTGEPAADVGLTLFSTDTSEVTVLPTSLLFTPADWFQPRLITLTGVDDSDVDGDITVTIVTNPAISTDAVYTGRNPIDVQVTNLDDD